MRFETLLLKVITILFIISSCNTSTQTVEGERIVKNKRSVTVPSFSADSAYMFIEKQLAFGPRVPNSDAHKLCGDYLINKLEEYGAQVIVQNFTESSFDNKTLQLRNIIASYKPQAKKRILLAAHWDTRPFADKDTANFHTPIDGANDGASGVAVLLEIARKLSVQELPKVGIDIIFFDGEDYGEYEGANAPSIVDGKMRIWWCLGSQYWANNPHKERYSAYYGILLDMVGAKDAFFHQEGYSLQFAPDLVKKIWNIGAELGYGNHFVFDRGGYITDDHVYVNKYRRIPCVDIIQYNPLNNSSFGDYWHTHNDNMSNVDKNTLKAVGQTLLEVLYRER